MNIRAKLKCPECGYVQGVEMPVSACQYFYECVNCKKVLKPKENDCCVFCSYADRLCPPKQMEQESNKAL